MPNVRRWSFSIFSLSVESDVPLVPENFRLARTVDFKSDSKNLGLWILNPIHDAFGSVCNIRPQCMGNLKYANKGFYTILFFGNLHT